MKIIRTWIVLCSFNLFFSFAGAQEGLPLNQSANAYDIEVVDQFTIEQLIFIPQANTRLAWDPNTSRYSVYGDLSTSIEGDTVRFSLGDANTPGLVLNTAESVESFNGQIIHSFSMKGMSMSIGENNVKFSFDPLSTEFIITGKVIAHFAGEAVESSLGSQDNPGILIDQAMVEHIHIHVGQDFSIAGLASSDPDILLKWVAEETFEGHGKMWINFEEGLALANLGSNSNPGMLLTGGALDSLNMEVVGGAFLFEVLPTLGIIHIKYSKDESSFNVTGIIATELPFVREGKKFGPYIVIDAGLGSNQGIVYDTENRKLHVENASFSIKGLEKGKSKEEVDVGGFRLKALTITIENNLPAGIAGKVEIPPGADVDAELLFTLDPSNIFYPFQINEISVSYLAKEMEAVIPMGSSGFNLVSIGGRISGMEDPTNAVFEGCLGFIYGDLIPLNFVIKSTNGTLAYFEADVNLKAHELIVAAEVYLGAFQSGEFLSSESPCPNWSPLLGAGNLELDFQWGVQYSVDGQLKMLAVEPFIQAKLQADLSPKGNFDAKAKVDLVIPKHIPIIGGKNLESIEGVVRYLPKHQDQSYAAGWAKLNFGFDHVFVGAKMNLGNGKISKLGSKAAKALVSDVENNPEGDPLIMIPTSTVYHTFDVSADPQPLYLQCDFQMTNLSHLDQNNGNITLTLIGPSSSDKYLIYLADSNLVDNISYITNQQGTAMAIEENFTSRYGFYAIESAAVNSSATSTFNGQPDVFLTPGTYTLQVEFFDTDGTAFTEDDFDFQISPVYPRPTFNLFDARTEPNNEIYYTLRFNSYLPDSTVIAVYTIDTMSHQGGVLRASYFYDESLPWAGDPSGTIRIVGPGIDGSTHYFNLNTDSLQYIYAVLDDHINPPVYSDILTLSAQTKIHGKITVESNSVILPDTFRILVYDEHRKILSSVSAEQNGTFNFFAPIQNTKYSLDISSSTSNLYITPNVSISGAEATATILNKDWLRLDLDDVGLKDISVEIDLDSIPPLIYGAIHAPGSAGSISCVDVLLFDAKDTSFIASTTSNETGYSFNLEKTSDEYLLRFFLPVCDDSAGQFHWDPHYFHEENVIYDGASGVRTQIVRFTNSSLEQNSKELNLVARPGIRGPVFNVASTDASGIWQFFENIIITLTGDQGTKLTAVTNTYGYALFESRDLNIGETYSISSTVPEGYKNNSNPTPFTWTGTDPFLTLKIFPNP